MLRHLMLKALHDQLRPRTYLEIGVHIGMSLTLSRAASIGIDPFFKVTREVNCDLHLVRATSDEFFARRHPLAHFKQPVIDLAFIDGMHLAEYALRDLINVERYTHAASVIVIDDMLPRNVPEAARDREGAGRLRRAWAGDVYKVIAALRELRPDLLCLEVDTEPTGTVVLFLPDPSSRILLDSYDDLVERYVVPDPQSVPVEVLSRSRAVPPEKFLQAPIWEDMRRLRKLSDEQARPELTKAFERSGLLEVRS